MMRRERKPARLAGWVAVICAPLWLVACGGGGGSGADGGSAPPIPTLSADVYPLASGDRRSWRTTQGGINGAIRHERVGEAVGAALVVRSGDFRVELPADEEYLQRSATGVSTVPGPNSDALSRAVGPVELLRFGMAQGQSVVLLDRTFTVDVDGDGRADSLDLRVESQFTGVEAVTTQLAAFADASRVRTSVRTTIRLAGASATRTISQTLDDWYVPGIGPVRSSSSTSTDGGAPVLETEEVVAYAVGNRRSEAVAPTVVAVSPASNATSAGQTGGSVELRLSFSEPVDPLSLKGAGGVQLLRDGQLVALKDLLLSADAKTLILLPTTSPLSDGAYEVRNGGQVSDWAGNLAPTPLNSFRVDTRGPRLQSSQPADGATEAVLSGSLSFDFDEALVAPAGVEVRVWLREDSVGDFQPLAASLQGRRIVAPLSAPLKANTAYVASAGAGLTDASGNPLGGVTIYFRTDPGAFARPQTWTPGLVPNLVTLADLDGDGRSDVVFVAQVLGAGPVLGVRRQQPDGTYAAAAVRHIISDSYCGPVERLAVGDIDGDGRADAVVRGGCSTLGMTRLLHQNPDGSFTAQPLPGDLMGPLAVIDGGVMGVTTAGLTYVSRATDGNWTVTVPASALTSDIRDWRSADLDGDGRQDLVWVQGSSSGLGYELGWQLRTASGWGVLQRRPLPQGSPNALATGDFDGDGRPEVVLAIDNGASGPASNGEIWLMKFNGAGGFADPQRLAAASGASALLVEDFNGDGRADIAVSHDILSRTGIYLQAASGGLEAERLFESGYGYFAGRRSLVWVDLTGDGLKDLVQAEVLLPGRTFAGTWPLGAASPAVQARSSSRVLRAATGALKTAGSSVQR